MPPQTPTTEHKQHKFDIRLQVWPKLREVALPDSRFDYDFSEFIADFIGSDKATNLLTEHSTFKDCIKNGILFITPDNCLFDLRFYMLNHNLPFLITTYGIKRGFFYMDSENVPNDQKMFAATLDGMEKWAKPITLEQIKNKKLMISMMITGTGCINTKGIRVGKGHGYFDMEWGMLHSIGCLDLVSTKSVAIVHDCQLVELEVRPEKFDTLCDLVVTNSKILEIDVENKPHYGIIWDLLQEEMLDEIPPLRELQHLQAQQKIAAAIGGI